MDVIIDFNAMVTTESNFMWNKDDLWYIIITTL